MRISSSLFFQTGLNSMNVQQSDLLHLYQKIGTGQRMVTPSDDPLAASQAINISQSQSMNVRFGENREAALRSLRTSESTLDTTVQVLQSLQTRLVEASNGTLSDTDRSTLAGVFRDARDALLGLANAKDGNGQYLFSGSRGNAPAFAEINGQVQYQGDLVQRKIQADPTRQIAATDVGSDIFARAAPGTARYLTSADTANSGTGLIGSPSIIDPKGDHIGKVFSIRFDSPTSYQVHVVEPATGLSQWVENGLYRADQSGQISLAGDVQVTFKGEPAAGDVFMVEPASSARHIAAIENGATTLSIGSVNVLDHAVHRNDLGQRLTFQSDSRYDVEVYRLSDNTVVQTMTDQMFVPGRENALALGNAMQIKIAGTPASGDQINITPAAQNAGADLNVFRTLDAVVRALETSTAQNPAQTAELTNVLATAIQRVDVVYDNVLTVRSSVGTRLNEIDALNANGQQRALGYSKELSRLEDLDYYEAITQLELRSMALEAATQAFRKMQSLSLFSANV